MTWTLDRKSAALVLVDLQNGVLNQNIQPHSGDEIACRSSQMADAFRSKGAPVVYVRVRLNDFAALASDKPTILPENPPPALSEIAPSAGMKEGDLVITKRHWGAFAGTNLEQELRARNIQTIVLAGVATNFGVESTLRQGTGLGFEFVIVEDACGTYTAEMQNFAFQAIFPRLSRVRTTAEVLRALD